MAEFKSTISSQNFDKALQGGLDYAADKSGIQEALKELSAKGFVYIGPDQPTDGTMYWLDTSAAEPDVPVVPDEPDVPDDPEVTLTSISATYSGGDVAVGTALTDLTGIVVTATYSDGSTAAVTGYTLSGAIAEGSNTITVTYEGKTATFTVTGVAASDDIHDGYVSDGLEFRQDWIRNTVDGHSSEVTPFTWADVSGNNYATTTSKSSFFAGVYDTYAEGPRAQQKVTSDVLMAKIANSFTAEVVCQPTNATNTNGVFSVSNGNNFRLIAANGQFRVCGNGTLNGTAMSNENAIRHLTYVYDGSTIKMYHDGALDTEIDATMDLSSYTFVEFWGNADYAHAFEGKYNAARLYSRALSAEEVKANYDNDVARFGTVNGEVS